jgi:MFS family permease
MRTFFIIWFGQVVSLMGSGLTSFALGVYVYTLTGSVTQLGLVLLARALPSLIISPVAGVIVDRWDRRHVMLLSDTGAGLASLGVWVLLATGNLEVWHIYVSAAFNSFFGAFQGPAYMASTTLLVPKEHYGRTAGLVQLGDAFGQILSPILAGFLILTIQIEGIILIDFATYLFAVVTLILVRIPRPKPAAAPQHGLRSIAQEAIYGWKYVKVRTGLFAMLLLFAFINFSLGIFSALYTPLVLSFATADVLGTIISFSGIGMLVGSLLMSAWGGTKRKVDSLFGSIFIGGLALSISGLQANPWLLGVSGFLFFFILPIANGSSTAIWQTKVEPGVQGRVFATRRMLASFATPLAYMLAGPLADLIFEPFMTSGGAIALRIASIIGSGPGRGFGLIFVILGLLISIASLLGYLYPRIRLVEVELPDVVEEIS